MRGRAKDPVVARAKARAHAKRVFYCDCGKVVHGNGGKQHFAMHERRRDGYGRISERDWKQLISSKVPAS